MAEERKCKGCGAPLPEWWSGEFCSYTCTVPAIRQFKLTGELAPRDKARIEAALTGGPEVAGE